MAKYLKQTKKDVFEVLKKIMNRYDNNLVYALQNKKKAIDMTLNDYWNYYEWLQDKNKKTNIKPKIIHKCSICNTPLNNGFCYNPNCIASTTSNNK